MPGRMVSPNEMFEEAKTLMLNGRDPVTKRDWVIVMNFFAHNIDPRIALEACQLSRVIFDMPLTEIQVIEIVQFQLRED